MCNYSACNSIFCVLPHKNSVISYWWDFCISDHLTNIQAATFLFYSMVLVEEGYGKKIQLNGLVGQKDSGGEENERQKSKGRTDRKDLELSSWDSEERAVPISLGPCLPCEFAIVLSSHHCTAAVFSWLLNVQAACSTAAVFSWLLNVPAACKVYLLRQYYVLPHWDQDCWSDLLFHQDHTDTEHTDPTT